MLFWIKVSVLALVGYAVIGTSNSLTDYRELERAEHRFDKAAAQLAKERENDGTIAETTRKQFLAASSDCEHAFDHVQNRWHRLFLL